MKLTSSQEAEIWQVYDTWLSAYLNADVKTYDAYLDDDYHFIGSTNNEEFLKRTDATMFFEQTGEQFAGIMDLRNEIKILEVFDTSIFITHFCDVWFINDEDRTYYGRFRLSSVMQKKNEGWRFIYQHFSMPDSKSDEGESIGFDKVNAENIELKEAIKRRTIELENKNRELEIESALERVRSASMAMQHPDDLDNVNKELLTQLQKLQIDGLSGVSIWLIDDEGLVTAWDLSSPGNMGDPNSAMVRYDSNKFDILGEPWRMLQNSDDDYFLLDYSAEKLQKAIKEWAQVDQEVADGFRNALLNGSLKHQWNPIARHSNGILSIDLVKPPADDTKEIVTKMAGAFSLAYRRFLDLQKAEAQAREAQIEAALEKVRSRTMAMQSSDELTEAATEMFSKIEDLGLNPWGCGFNIFNDDKTVISQWVSTGDGRPIEPFDTPATEGIFKRIVEQSENDEPLYIEKMEGKKLEDTYKYMASLPTLDKIFEELDAAGIELPKKQVDHAAYFKHGYLMFITYEETPEFHSIFKRFANVFEQTYTRFLDLQKAEKQAREAQIENALEKVRSRSLAMQHPNELVEVVQLLREEMGALGVEELETSSIYIHDDTSGLTQCWFTIKDADDPGKSVTDQMTIDLQDTWVGRQMNQFYGSGQDSTSILMKGDHRVEWIRYCEEMSDLFGTSEFYGDTIPERSYHLYKFSNGFLGAASPGKISDESWDLMRRATGAFSFAYTRFSDLQKAEESARRGRQQASLDRVRADISSMRSAEDLNKITPLVWDELTNLGIPFIRCGVFIIHENEEQVEVYLSKPDGTSLAVMHLPFGSSELAVKTVDAWRLKNVYTQHWNRKEFLEWGRAMMEQNQVADMKTYQGAEKAPESLHLHFIPFNQGMLYVGSTGPLKDEEITLSESLAKAFSIAYARYEDFVKLEKAKAGIEDALSELKATQSQLVQQEKLASLGQLTAGIAHEIKNPLNFVNNFSDVSLELVEEVRDEVRRMTADGGPGESPLEGSAEAERRRGVLNKAPNDSFDPDLILEILDDIEANLKTIHKHGSRADSIVKSMLQHSRGGDGKMESTPLNSLIKEYVNLAFHGMRAGNEPINVDIDLQLDDEVGEVALIAEDFSRVILNLVNNAFDAMRSKLTEDGGPGTGEKYPLEGSGGAERSRGVSAVEVYHPQLVVRTKRTDGSVTIEIEDNGPGIPDDMKDKILQPFFTTKKGTAGTGLGLSITNDIVKAHGGSLEIVTKPQKGSTFIISLNQEA